jgi:insulysin
VAKIRLENGLEAYLISDPGVKESAGALAVEAGSWQDPKEYPGMAHFLEHMLFMGTKAYPHESEYERYIHDHSGELNAYTSAYKTVYGFTISNDAFKGAVDRFSHFFIDPLFLQSCIARELHAVDQEHAKNIENDSWRSYMILKETGNQNHPNAGFATGNAATLGGIPQEALKNWYKTHYSANRMHLVLLSSLPLNELISCANAAFSPVVNHHLPLPSYPQGLLSSEQKGHFIYIKPVKDLKEVSLWWEMPKEIAQDRDTQVTTLLKYLLSNECENSLAEALKREKLIENLTCGSYQLSPMSQMFILSIDLTEAGLKQLPTIFERVFQTLAGLKNSGLPRFIFDETKKLSNLAYEYQSREEAFEFVMNTAAALVYESLPTFPEQTLVPASFNPTLFQTLLSSLTPHECTYFVLADPKLTGVEMTTKEKWMDAPYTIKPIPSSQLLAWSEAKPNPRIGLPSPNPYLPTSLALLSNEKKEAMPSLLDENDPLGKAYFSQDTRYLVPETAAIFSLKSPLLDGSAKSRALFDLYNRSLHEKLSSSLFFAQEAGISLLAEQNDFGFDITVSGYSDKIGLFLTTVFEAMKTVLPTQAEFEIYQQSLLSSYDNESKELPCKQSMQLLKTMLYNHTPTAKAKYGALKNLSYEEFLHFLANVFNTAYANALIYGNLTKEEAALIWSSYKTTLKPDPFPPEKHYKKGVLYPKETDGPYLTKQTTERQGNSTALVLYEGPFSFEMRAIQQILSSALHDDFYETLRTKQQTGYIASSSDLEVERQLMQFFVVQSNTHEPGELLARFELFLEEFSRQLQEKISLERFDVLKTSLIKELKMPPDNLSVQAKRLANLAFNYDADFDWMSKRIEATEALSYNTFCQNASALLSRQNHRRIAVLMQGELPPQNLFRYEAITADEARSIGNYVSVR